MAGPCPCHPRLNGIAAKNGVDARHKAGHDGVYARSPYSAAARFSSPEKVFNFEQTARAQRT